MSPCLVSCLLLSLEDVLGALRGVIGRRHPSTAQSRQLKHTLPTMSVVLELLSSQVMEMDQKAGLILPAPILNVQHSILHFALNLSVFSQVFRSQIVTKEFLAQIGLLLVSVW